jgi:CheY-like chemotaxis protein/HPt (histidine-containing phosphotransfer) domain-containing protein
VGADGLSSLADGAVDGLAQEVGIDGYLAKPVRRAELFEVIAMVMGQEAAREQLVTRHLARERRRRVTILLAEDNPVNQRVASTMLERLGHRVDIAGDGAEAVATFRAGRYDAVLMDCQMPVMDGFEATRQIRAEAGGTIPIIALTASATSADRQACLEAGMNDHLAKPIQPAALEAALDRWLDASSATAGEAIDVTEDASLVAGAAGSIIDESVVRSIVELDASLLASMVDVFETDVAEQLAAIRASVQIGDLPAVRSAAHRMKGGAGALGAVAAANACARLEQAADANRAASVTDEVVEVERLTHESIAGLRAWVPTG